MSSDKINIFPSRGAQTLMKGRLKEASFSLAEAKFASGDFNHAVLQNMNKAQIKIKTRKDNVTGVNLRVFEPYQDGADSNELTGLAKGGQQLKRLKANFGKLKYNIVGLFRVNRTIKNLRMRKIFKEKCIFIVIYFNFITKNNLYKITCNFYTRKNI